MPPKDGDARALSFDGLTRQMTRQTSPGLHSTTSSKRSVASVLNPTGATAALPPPRELGPWMEIFIFMAFIFIRAIHPIVIDGSKTFDDEKQKKTLAYQTSSVVIMQAIILAGISQVHTLAVGGKKLYAIFWEPKSFALFFTNGVVYAFGDYLEVMSIGSLSGAAYQILLQSKIIVTAAMLMVMKGVHQTRLQWILLSILMLSMSVYMVSAKGDAGPGKSQAAVPIIGVVLAFFKVLISCGAAVVCDKYIKVYKDDAPIVHLSQTWLGLAVAAVILSFTGDTWANGFLSGWDEMTCAVVISFTVKAYSSMYIVALLDAILKNIGESLSVLVIYAYDVLAPWVRTSFDVPTFLSILVVVAACAAYIDAKTPIEKAAAYDKQWESNGM